MSSQLLFCFAATYQNFFFHVFYPGIYVVLHGIEIDQSLV